MSTTKKPTGLAVARDGNLKFAISWKIGDKDYGGGHQLRYRAWKSATKHTAWTNVTMGASKTSKTVTLSTSDWNPNSKKPTMASFEFQVRGKRATADGKTYDWSAWADKKWTIKAPEQPTVTTTVTATNATTFAWSVSTSTTNEKPFLHVEYQTFIMKACKETDGSKLNWTSSQTGWATSTSTSTSSSLARTETSSDLAKDSYTRWFRIRSRGAGGDSKWTYAKHVYARPYAATIKSKSYTVANSVTTVNVTWEATADAAHPIDETTVQYCIGKPNAGMVCPGTPTDAITIKDTNGIDGANFNISGVIDEDECLWVRVANKHDSNTTYSAWERVQTGVLKAPTAMTVTYNNSTNVAAVTALTKGTAVTDAQHAVVYRGANGQDVIVGIIASNASTLSNIKVPSGTASPSFGIFAFQGTATGKSSTGGVTVYSVNANMKSATFWQGGTVPSAPANFTADRADSPGEVILTWSWSWSDANKAEISWSTNPNAWESTDAPSTYVIDSIRAGRWRVSGLTVGEKWYFQIRLIQDTDDGTIYGPYAEQKSVDLSSAPNAPVMELSSAVIAPGGSLTATWDYTSTDGTQQDTAKICVATVVDNATPPITYGTVVATVQTAQHADIDTSTWTTGTTYYLCVSVHSASGKTSAWSDPVPVFVAAPISISVTSSLASTTVTDSDNVSRTVTALTSMPFTATITGAGAGGTTTLIIERAEDYRMERPDESIRDGYAGETIAQWRQTGEAQISIATADLIGRLDDGASYNLIATIEDGFGQSKTSVTPFEVHWGRKPTKPTATVTTASGVAKITVTATSTQTGDTCDIYRLSVDKPQLIVQGGSFNTQYVDPYPTIGPHAGYRAVNVTAYGDYVTSTNEKAWDDVTGQLFDNKTGYIHFNGESIPVQFNVGLSSSWKKDFKETKYLGGTVRGDWNPAISRSCSVSLTIPTTDTTAIEQMRRLADWSGICHVRSQDGSSYAADVQVSSKTSYSVGGNIEDFTLSITRVEPETLDGVTSSEYGA